MRTRPASIATVVIAIGLALTSAGIAHGLPYTFGGVGSSATISADLWAHGTALSPALVALACIGILAAIAMRPTRGGRRSAAWLAVLAAAVVGAGLAEPAQQALLLGDMDPILTPVLYAFHVGLIALILSALGEARRSGADEDRRLGSSGDLLVVPADEAPVSAVVPGVPGPATRADRAVAPGLVPAPPARSLRGAASPA